MLEIFSFFSGKNNTTPKVPLKVPDLFLWFSLLTFWGTLSFSANVVAQNSGNILDVIEKNGFDQGDDQQAISSLAIITQETGTNTSNFQLEARQIPATFDALTLNLIVKFFEFFWLLRYLVIGIIILYVVYFLLCFVKGLKSAWQAGKVKEQQQKNQRGKDKRIGTNTDNSSEMTDVIRDKYLSIKTARIIKEILSSSQSPKNPPK